LHLPSWQWLKCHAMSCDVEVGTYVPTCSAGDIFWRPTWQYLLKLKYYLHSNPEIILLNHVSFLGLS
jgi:hypothetical protein